MSGQDWLEKDYYAALGVPKDADQAAIKKAYRKLARQMHPDHNPGDSSAEARFKEVGEAYSVLSDPEQRQQYDQLRAMAGGPRQGADLEAVTTLPFRQATEGSTVSLSVEGRTVNARIPPGVHDGQKIRLRGKGRPGANGGPAGDLVVTVRVTPHPVFTLDGNNLRETVPVSFDEAALGAQIEVPTLDGGTVRLKVPAGTPSGRTLRVKGRGITTSKGTGDLLVTVLVVVPQKLTGAARDAVEAFGVATAGEDVRADLRAQART